MNRLQDLPAQSPPNEPRSFHCLAQPNRRRVRPPRADRNNEEKPRLAETRPSVKSVQHVPSRHVYRVRVKRLRSAPVQAGRQGRARYQPLPLHEGDADPGNQPCSPEEVSQPVLVRGPPLHAAAYHHAEVLEGAHYRDRQPRPAPLFLQGFDSALKVPSVPCVRPASEHHTSSSGLDHSNRRGRHPRPRQVNQDRSFPCHWPLECLAPGHLDQNVSNLQPRFDNFHKVVTDSSFFIHDEDASLPPLMSALDELGHIFPVACWCSGHR